MIPYFQLTAIHIGPIAIQVWGLMVASGIIAATVLMNKLAKKYFLSPQVILDMAIWVLITAFIGARVFHIVFYEPEYYLMYPAEALKFWHGGLSSLGGFFGAGIALFIFAKLRKFSWKELLPYFDIAAVSLWLGWGIGRIGCVLTHLHPGRRSDFFLAIAYPGGARHDLGLYESIVGFALFIIFALLFKRLIKRGWGHVAGYSTAAYAIIRFFLDFLRATDLAQSDARYASLTPAQWGMIAVVLGLIFLLIRGKMNRQKQPV